jgi:hypothetical protein
MSDEGDQQKSVAKESAFEGGYRVKKQTRRDKLHGLPVW